MNPQLPMPLPGEEAVAKMTAVFGKVSIGDKSRFHF
jgi:hypothetical protein